MKSNIRIKDKKKYTIVYNTIMLYVMQISNYIFPLFTFPYLARILGTNYYGMMTFVTSVMVYFQMIVDFGFLLSGTQECSLYRDDKNKLTKVFSSIVISKIFLSIIGFFILFLIVKIVPNFNDKKMFTMLYYLTVVTSVLMPDYLFRGLEKMSIITSISIVGKLIYTISIFIFIKNSSDYLVIPILVIFSNIVTFSLMYKEVKKLGIKLVWCDFRIVLSTLKNSFIFFVSRIASTAYSASNVVVLGMIISNVDLALYGVANTIINTIKSFLSPIADSIYPYILREKNFKLVKKIIIISTPVMILATFLLYLLAKPIILILGGREYINAVPIFRMMLPIIIITLPSYLLGFPVLGAMNRMREANLAVVYVAIFHSIGLIILIITRLLNINNVILLTIISEMLVLIIRTYYILKGNATLNKKVSNEKDVPINE